MWFGMTASRIRSFFKALRKAARKEGGAIGFIEEIDAIGGSRDGLGMSPAPGEPDGRAGSRTVSNSISSGTGGMVNELLIQMQSFDQPPRLERMRGKFIAWINTYLPPERRLTAGKPAYNNILLIAATNRADSLDSALLRPGRFDRRLYFDLPTKQGRHGPDRLLHVSARRTSPRWTTHRCATVCRTTRSATRRSCSSTCSTSRS